MSRRVGKIKFLNAGVRNYLCESVPDKIYLLVQIRREWLKIVGKSIAQHSYPYQLANRLLTVFVDDPIWIQELTLQKDTLKESIFNHFNTREIHDSILNIKFRNGEVRLPEPENPADEEKMMKLEPAILRTIDRTVSGIEDPDLKKAMRSYLIKSSLMNEE